MEQTERLQYYFQILADTNRLRIIKIISDRELSVSEIVKESNMSQPLVSHHLKVLKNSQILDTKRSGPFVFYKLADVRFLEILGLFEDILPKESPQADFRPMFCCPQWWKAFHDF